MEPQRVTFKGVPHDVAWAIRSLRRAPMHVLFVIGALSVGIAAATSTFSIVNSLFYRPFPYRDAGRIVTLSSVSDGGLHAWSAQPIEFVDRVRIRSTSFERVAAFEEKGALMEGPSGFSRISRTAIDTSVTRLIGATLAAGRFPSPAEIREGASVAVISDSLQRSQFSVGGAIGQWIALDHDRFQVVGVLAPGIRFYRRSDVLIPLNETQRGAGLEARRTIGMLAKLKVGRTIHDARLDAERIGAELARDDPRFAGWRFLAEPEMFDRGSTQAEALAWLVTAMAAGVLLIACANAAMLQLVRAAARSGDAAVRAALGATRGRLVREHIAEGALLCALGGVGGIGLAYWCVHALVGLVPLNLPSWVRFGIDLRVAAFALIASFVAVCGIAIWPAMTGFRVDAATTLRGAAPTIASPHTVLDRGEWAVCAQVAASVVLGVCAALLWHSHREIVAADLGYEAASVQNIRLTYLIGDPTSNAADTSAYQLAQLTAGLTSVTGVAAVAHRAYAGTLWIDRRGADTTAASGSSDAIALYTDVSPTQPVQLDVTKPIQRYAVSDSYFATLGIRMLAGDGFTGRHQMGSPPAVVVSQSLARHLWSDGKAVGHHIRIGTSGTQVIVIGICSDTWDFARSAVGLQLVPQRTLYLSERQAIGANPSIMVRTQSPSGAAAAAHAVAARASELGLRVAVTSTASLGDEAVTGYSDLSALGMLLGAMSGVGILLSIVGLYGLVAVTVSARTREIGVRLALGSTTAGVVQRVSARGLRAVASGVVVGSLLAAAIASVFNHFDLLFKTQLADPQSLGLVIAVILPVAASSCYLAARRAARIHPSSALRG